MTVQHPAKFSDPILGVIAEWIPDNSSVLDPFAGVGRIHYLRTLDRGIRTYGVEIEPEWAEMARELGPTECGDATAMWWWGDEKIDVIATSPTYGNRMADHHEARDVSKRITYRHSLGRALQLNNSGRMKWGDAYRGLHRAAWAESVRVLKPGGRFILNISDHIRGGERVRVSDWHVEVLEGLGLRLVECVEIPTKRMGFGANREVRVDCEYVVVLEKP